MPSTSEKCGLFLLRWFSLSTQRLALLDLPELSLKRSLFILCWLLSSTASHGFNSGCQASD